MFIRRKEIEPVFGDPPARHIARNTIELMPDYFDLTPAEQAVSLLHEMGHWAIGMTAPRDERDDLCSGGWNREENMCYRDVAAITDMDSRFRSGNPRTLAIAADRGSGHALGVALNNIDNYVCWMWNRFNDHQTAVMRLLPPGAKPLPRDEGKPKPGQDPRVGELPPDEVPDGPARRRRTGGKPIPDAGGGKGKTLGKGKPAPEPGPRRANSAAQGIGCRPLTDPLAELRTRKFDVLRALLRIGQSDRHGQRNSAGNLDGAAIALHRAAESATAAAAVLAAMDRGRPNDSGDPGVAAVNIARVPPRPRTRDRYASFDPTGTGARVTQARRGIPRATLITSSASQNGVQRAEWRSVKTSALRPSQDPGTCADPEVLSTDLTRRRKGRGHRRWR